MKTTKIKVCVICQTNFVVDWVTRKKITCSPQCQFKLKSVQQKERGVCPADIRTDKWLEAMQSEENRNRASKLHLGAIRQTEQSARFSANHIRARHFWVKSPANKTYRVDNVRGFVHDNENLFNREDVAWIQSGRYRSEGCRASNGLSSLVRNVNPRHSWKGWTLTEANLAVDNPLSVV